MSRSSTPWDEPDTNPNPPALPDASDALAFPESPDVMASVDATHERPEFVIADVSREDAWVSVEEVDAAVLEEWC
ncbi:hypothetical protein GCM10027435_23270 [Haloparvum alkalitolerans]|uniref:DUF7556 family protein n=1 Tax=Haloparvum alkalitolerans TaxID=1042953 RepID=UPI003CF17DBE